MSKKEKRTAKKEYLYNITVGGFYAYKVYKITDAALQVYYVAHPVGHGGTVLADKEQDIRPQLERQAVILNDWLSKTK
ncbi:MAG: hypothetical protein II670_02145 [Alphaproteobacteria bacterium]|nr:hypothetical protein [Alphaproteobacteria bacterium]